MTATPQIQFTPVNIEARKNIDMQTGDTIKVWLRIKEGEKTRLQAFEGLVIARKHGAEEGATFTVRRVSKGYGVERVFPLYSPVIEKIELIKRSKTKRSKLYYIRDKAAKEIRKKMKQLKIETKILLEKEIEKKEGGEKQASDESKEERRVAKEAAVEARAEIKATSEDETPTTEEKKPEAKIAESGSPDASEEAFREEKDDKKETEESK